MFPHIAIETLPNTSAITIRHFKSLGIKTYFDLLNYFPSRYDDYSVKSRIVSLQPGETVTVRGMVTEAKFGITRGGMRLQRFVIADETGEVDVTFFNQPYLLRLIKKGQEISVAGVVSQFGRKIIIEPKDFELTGKGIHTGRLVPVYPQVRGLSSKTIREKIYVVLHPNEKMVLEELLPQEILQFNNLISDDEAYRQIHFPDSFEKSKTARDRLAFDELFTVQLSSHLIKSEWQKEKVGHQLKEGAKIADKVNQFINHLPFTLTQAQIRAWGEIKSDLLESSPMNRFLQGEVGSGKTVVAALASYLAFLNGFQSLLMAPTEILAQQHYKTMKLLFDRLKISPKISLVTGVTKKDTTSDIVVGTHAIISKKNKYDNVGLVIVDEQHRFGVAQRAALKAKGINPHLLSMTATPIPRTVALTLYGELDLSVIDELPASRLPIKTYLVPPEKRAKGYRWIADQIKNSRAQVFIVCPLIEESTVETMKAVKAAKKEFENLKSVFSGFNLGLLHGKIKGEEKEKIMNDFRARKIDILVATPVVEVGVDIPGATIMVIEGAERFGLAQLHQLRGRVGRADKQSYCFLFTDKPDMTINERLRFFATTVNGNKLAEKDLEIRGPGNIYGIKQSGYIDLKIASLSDYALIEKTKKAVEYFVAHKKISDFKALKKRLKKTQVGEVSSD